MHRTQTRIRMSTTKEKPDSQQYVRTMLEEKMHRIAQLEEDWLGINDECSASSSQDSSPRSERLEQDKTHTNDGLKEDQDYNKNIKPKSPTAVNQVWIRLDEVPVTPNKRKMDKHGNLTPLPPATLPPEASSSLFLPSVSAKKVVVSSALAAASSSNSTVSLGQFDGHPISGTYHSQLVKESSRRPCKESKAWKATGAADVYIDDEASPQDTLVVEGLVNGPGEHATQDASRENRQSKNKSECVENTGLGLHAGLKKLGGEAENDEHKMDEIIKGHGGTDSDRGLNIRNGNMVAESIDEEEHPSQGADTDVPRTDGIADRHDETKGDDNLDVENEETGLQHPVKVDIADEAGPVRRFTSRGLALYMEARGFVEQDKGQEAVEQSVEKIVIRGAQKFSEWGLTLLLEAMDGRIGI